MMSDPRGLASVLAIAGGMFLTAAAQAQTTWYVDNGNCPGPGSGSERDPFCKIQVGIDASRTGDEVVVADGTYTGIRNRDLDFGGRAKFGPDLEWIEAIDYRVEGARAELFYDAIRRYYPALAEGALLPDYAGVRPSTASPGSSTCSA